MDYIPFGHTGLKVSRLAFGLGFRGQADPNAAERTIERAVELGINFIDCANVYGLEDDRANAGMSEQILGRILKRHRDNLVISSKVCGRIGQGPNDAGLSRYHIMREIDRTLDRLDTDHIDVYILHTWDATTPLDETLRTLDDLVRTGKTRYVGVSNFQAWQVLKARWIQDRLGLDPLVCIQNPYNLLNRDLEREMWPAQHDQGFGVMTYSPLGAGLLSGLYTAGREAPAGSLYATVLADQFAKEMNQTAQATLEVLQEIAAERGKTTAQVAINWVLSHSEVSLAITGGDTVEHMEDNVGAVGWSLSAEERARLDEVSAGTRHVLD
ncbi:MAG: aldo/keto reductase [Candidatus Latescibacteria bacterium]|nr:aldo/keto reductase [Candidatus Latescibacterota bacterium]